VFWKADLGLRLIGVAESKKALKWRIKHMLNRPIPKSSKLGALGIIVVFTIAAILLPMAKAQKSGEHREPVASENEQKPAKTLHQAAEDGDLAEVKRLIAEGADVNAADQEHTVKWTPLIAAASGGDVQVVKVLLENRAKVNATDSHGYTPLYYALWTDGNNSEEIVRALIASGADVNKRSPSDKRYPPLAFAIWLWEGREGNVKALLDAGADVGVKDDNGLTALYWAAFDSSKDVLDLILANGNYANTIHLAACREDLSRVKTLIEEGTDVNARDEFGCTPLHWAVLAESPDVADFLIAKGADINAKDTRNLSPLMAARGYPRV